MIQASGSGKNVIELSQSRSAQQPTSWFSRHTQDVSDASLAEFERLMAAMGYRQVDSTIGSTIGRTGTTG